MIIALYTKSAASEEENFCETKTNGEVVCLRNNGYTAGITCDDGHEMCAEWARIGECEANSGYMLENCKRSCKLCVEDDRNAKIYAAYYRKRFDGSPCRDDHDDCPHWKSEGKCESNVHFMVEQCRSSCSMCSGQTHSRSSILPPKDYVMTESFA